MDDVLMTDDLGLSEADRAALQRVVRVVDGECTRVGAWTFAYLNVLRQDLSEICETLA